MDSCEHLRTITASSDGAKAMAAVQRAVRTSSVQPSRALEEPVTPRPPRRIPAFACVTCATGFSTRARAVAHHAASGHALAIDTGRAEVFCCACRDYVFDDTVDAAISAARSAAATQLAGEALPERQPVRPPSPAPPPLDPANSHARDSSCGTASSAPPAACGDADPPVPAAVPAGTADALPAGLRGLNNLGQTCFMNSVLQALLHAPLLRRFFLGEGHPAGGCPRAASSQACLSCELDALFGEVYGGGRAPISPVAFLRTWWHTAGGHLEGYQQQDAHEFYLNALSGLSTSLATPVPSEDGGEEGQSQDWGLSGGGTSFSVPALTNALESPMRQPRPPPQAFGSPGSPVLLPTAPFGGGFGREPSPGPLFSPAHQFMQPPPDVSAMLGSLTPDAEQGAAAVPAASSQSFASSICTDDGETDGIVQRVFGGLLRSDVTCRACGHTSTAFDPFLDLSLDLPPAPALPQVWQRSSAAKPPRPTASAPQAAARPPRPPQPAAAHAVADACDATGGTARQLRGAISGRPGSKRSSPEPDTDGLATRSVSVSGTRSPSVDRTLSRARTPCSSGGSQSIYRDASSVSPRGSEASSVNEGTLGDAPTSVSVADDTVEPGPSPQSPPLPKAVKGLRAPKPKPAGKGGVKGRKGRARTSRCGACHHCRHPNLKKACLDPRPATPPGAAALQAAAAVPAPASAAADAAAPAASDPGPGQHLTGALGRDSSEDRLLPEVSGTTEGGGVERCGNGCTSAASGGDGSTAVAAAGGGMAQHRTGGGPVSKAATAAAAGGASLLGCLARFVRPEKLGPRDHWQCARCRARQRAVKQMSIARLPPVLVLHVKRFEAGGIRSQAPRKLATPVSFPLEAPLDMRPFLSSAVLQRRCGLGADISRKQEAAAVGDAAAEAESAPDAVEAAAAAQYRAYAVVCHHGNMQGGHYTAYVRAGEQWYLCDDGWVSAVPAPEVRRAQAFQLFYARADLAGQAL